MLQAPMCMSAAGLGALLTKQGERFAVLPGSVRALAAWTWERQAPAWPSCNGRFGSGKAGTASAPQPAALDNGSLDSRLLAEARSCEVGWGLARC